MPRRSLRTSSAGVTHPQLDMLAAGSSSSTPQLQRSKTTPKKSKYFDERPDRGSGIDSDDADAADAELSGYEDEDASLSEPSSEDDVDDDYASDESSRPRKKQKRGVSLSTKARSTRTTAKIVKGQELWRPGVKTGLGPGTQVIIDKPKARSVGKTAYTDDTIHPNTMMFLGELAENNDREWLKMHDPDYRASLKDFDSYVESLQVRLIGLDDTIPELPTKDIVFRIYRDVRFSPDPTPYKTHFSAAWSRTGRKGPFAAYYVQIKPGGSFVGGGLWMPEAQHLAALRRDIDKRPRKIKQVLLEPGLRKQFLGGIGENEKKAVKAFVNHNADNALKTKPKGYDADHQDVELLRLRNFTVGRTLNDTEIMGKQGIVRVTELFSCLVPFVTYLNSVVMPDHGDEDNETVESEHASESSS